MKVSRLSPKQHDSIVDDRVFDVFEIGIANI